MTRAAVLDLELVSRNGKRKSIRVSVATPRRHLTLDWFCPIRITGLDDKGARILGVDSWQALTLALRYVEAKLRSEVRRGARLYLYGKTATVNQLFVAGIGK